MPYDRIGQRGMERSRHRPSTDFGVEPRGQGRMTRSRSQSAHRPGGEFQPDTTATRGASLLMFPNRDVPLPNPLEPVRPGEGKTKRPERESGTEEGAVGGTTGQRRREERRENLRGLEGFERQQLAVSHTQNKVEIVVPYTWPAERSKGESEEAYESRLAEHELESFLRHGSVYPTRDLARLKSRQSEAMSARQKPALRKEDMESTAPTPREARSHSPHPGPPNRREPVRREAVSAMSAQSSRNSRNTATQRPERVEEKRGREVGTRRAPLKVKTSGVIFGNLKAIPTVSAIDPPPYACFQCWRFDHKLEACQSTKRWPYCLNCGRRLVTVETCPRCAEAYARRGREVVDRVERVNKQEETEARRPTREETSSAEVKDREMKEKGGDEDLTAKILEITRALAGLPASTIDKAINQLLEERRTQLGKRADV
ncbi:uncharacterized protein LOC127290969 [Leptopilina boulardi]|uniref:uncharacterized protein LOC127290969 n=1 Tax=Leptopilina boulardi TaxID=63433 RepID=UPI0021F5DEF4|nr:uncharacterized protein LOC127290969 [Leptopilina boulardi]